MKIKHPSQFLKNRRLHLNLDQQNVAEQIGINWDTYRQWECRGEIPDKYIPAIAKALRVSELDLLIEKTAPQIISIFSVTKEEFADFVREKNRR
jgi:transcriptional regulator with XRE-family HTH domain